MAFPLFNLGKNIVLSNLNLLQNPYKLTFAITYRCNLRCKTCNIWQKKSVNELSIDEIKKTFQNNQFSWINLTGGEPFLRDDLNGIIRTIIAESQNLYFLNFTSNGYLPDKILKEIERMLSFINIPKFAVGVSIEGPKKIDEKIRGNANSFQHALQTFKGLRRILKNTKYQTFISYTISPENLGQIQATIEFIRAEVPDFKLNEFNLNFFHHSSHYYGNRKYQLNADFAASAAGEVKTYLDNFIVPANPDTWLEKKYLRLLINYIKQQKTPLPCQALRASCYLDPQGRVYPCAMYDRIIGSLREEDYKLSGVWRREETYEVRRIIADYKCPNCWTPCEAYQTILGNLI